jgi:HemY protein
VIRFYLYALFALGVGAALALLLSTDPGYLLIRFRGTTIEATLATLIVSVLLLLVLVIAVSWLLRLLNPMRLFSGGWFRGAPARGSSEALELLLLGRWQEAYKLFVETADRMDAPEFNYLLAALAAFQRGDTTSWHWCLDQAERKAPGTLQGIKSFRALLETRAGNPDLALPILLALLRLAPASPFVLTQIKDIYVTHNRWDELATLLPEMEKQKVIDAAELQTLTANAHAQRLEQAAATGIDSLHLAWHDLPKALKHNELLVSVYLRKLLELGQDTEAGALLTSHLKKDWSDNLVGMLGFVHVRNPQEALLMMEGWLKQRPNSPVLLLTLGRLCLRNQLWGKAREYFELALRVTKSPELAAEISAELARLLEHLGEAERSLEHYQRAMGALKYPLPDVPLPVKR